MGHEIAHSLMPWVQQWRHSLSCLFVPTNSRNDLTLQTTSFPRGLSNLKPHMFKYLSTHHPCPYLVVPAHHSGTISPRLGCAQICHHYSVPSCRAADPEDLLQTAVRHELLKRSVFSKMLRKLHNYEVINCARRVVFKPDGFARLSESICLSSRKK